MSCALQQDNQSCLLLNVPSGNRLQPSVVKGLIVEGWAPVAGRLRYDRRRMINIFVLIFMLHILESRLIGYYSEYE